MSSTPPQVPSTNMLNGSIGALFIGTIINAIFYGVTCDQTFTYYMKSKKRDTWIMQSLVGILWIFNTIDIGLIAHAVYFYAIKNFSNPASLRLETWTEPGFNVLANLNDLLIRGIFIHRVWKLSQNLPTTIILWVANISTSSLGIVLAARIAMIGDLMNLDSVSWLLKTQFSLVCIIDTAIAIVLCIILAHMKTGFSRTDSQIQTLIRFSIHTGALTSIVAISIVVTYAAMPHNFVYIAIFLSLPRLYLNALLAMLNARGGIIAESDTNASSSLKLSSLRFVNHSNPVVPPSYTSDGSDRSDLVAFKDERYGSTSSKIDVKISHSVIVSRDV
ncbi:hypothetical protein ABKN59_002281 [Abortiporus biennis]